MTAACLTALTEVGTPAVTWHPLFKPSSPFHRSRNLIIRLPPIAWQGAEPLPADRVACKTYKIANDLLSGRYSVPPSTQEIPPLSHDSLTPALRTACAPRGSRHSLGRVTKFSTMKQQDSGDFHAFTEGSSTHKRTQDTAGGVDPTQAFTFTMEQRLEFTSCNRVGYRNDELDAVSVAVPAIEESKDAEGKVVYRGVSLTDTLDILTGDEGLEYTCPQCNRTVVAYR